jgi:hypothetical protein
MPRRSGGGAGQKKGFEMLIRRQLLIGLIPSRFHDVKVHIQRWNHQVEERVWLGPIGVAMESDGLCLTTSFLMIAKGRCLKSGVKWYS